MKFPDGPKTPTILQIRPWVADPVGYMEKAAAVGYGDIFLAGNSRKYPVFVSHPQALQQIFTKDTKQFTAPSQPKQIWQPLIGDYSLLLLSDVEHRRMRQLLMPPFHGERMLSYGKPICDRWRCLL